jgi:nucleoside 2-deoxyribosyltransferase
MLQFREHLVGYTLREIDDLFTGEGVQKGTAPDNINGERRSLIEAFYSSINLNRIEDKNKLLKVYEAVLIPLTIRNPDASKALINWLERDGFNFKNNQIVSHDSEESEVVDLSCWIPNRLRFFISHRDVKKVAAKQLAAQLEDMGASCFVAHDSIQPMSVWKFEIEKALKTMDAFVCFITDDYYESVWTNQEIGFALAKKIPIYLYSHDRTDPKGFNQDIQAIKTGPDTLLQLIKRDFGTHPSIKQILLSRVIEAKNGSFENAKNKFIEIADLQLSDFEIERLVEAINGPAKYINQLSCLLYDPIKPSHLGRAKSSDYTFYRDLLGSIFSQHTQKRFQIIQEGDRWLIQDKFAVPEIS